MEIVGLPAGLGLIAQEMNALGGESSQPRPVEVALPIASDVDVNQLIGLLQSEKSAQLAAAVTAMVHDHARLNSGDNHDMLMAGSTRNVAVAWR